jgi:uncharacterized protein (TIGR03435 family)
MGAGLWVPQAGVLLGQGVSTKSLAAHLSQQFRRVVVDNTSLRGNYDFRLQWAPDADDSASRFAAVQEQLGLQLTEQTGPVDMIVIDVAKPAETVAGSAAQSRPVLQPQAQSAPQEGVSIAAKGTANALRPLRSHVVFKLGLADFTNASLKEMLEAAYRADDSQLSGGPSWIETELFDMTVKTAAPLRGDELRQEVKKALTERFRLAIHRELKSLAVYELVPGSKGSKLSEAHPGNGPSGNFVVDDGYIAGKNTRLKPLVDYLQSRTGVPVVDKTGLKATYDFTATIPGEHRLLNVGGNDNTSLFRALSEQLGLEMRPRTEAVAILVIDHAEAPASGHEMPRTK